MYGGYYPMDSTSFGNNMQPIFGSMYEFPLMPPQATPFYNQQSLNVNNSNNNINNNNNSSCMLNRVPSMCNILDADNNNSNNNNVVLYNVNTRNKKEVNA